MKKYYTFIFCFLTGISSIAQTTYIPDSNFEQALIDLGYDDVLDNFVLTSNISGVIDLNVFYKNIQSLEGIEDFIALEKLNFSYNEVSEVNLQQNSNLVSLIGYYNQLLEIDLSQNLLLEKIDLGANYLSEIDV
ncbi:MAG: hypothetical protein WCY25_01160 [Moheibacter sp.]